MLILWYLFFLVQDGLLQRMSAVLQRYGVDPRELSQEQLYVLALILQAQEKTGIVLHFLYVFCSENQTPHDANCWKWSSSQPFVLHIQASGIMIIQCKIPTSMRGYRLKYKTALCQMTLLESVTFMKEHRSKTLSIDSWHLCSYRWILSGTVSDSQRTQNK